jgi:hypothetical protein
VFAQDIGTNKDNLPLTQPQLGSIVPVVTETGFITWSVDGTNGGTVQAEKPAGATVRSAYLAAASTGFSGRQLNDGHVSIDGQPVSWAISTPSSINSWNHWAVVTSLVKTKIDAAPAGRVDFSITEVSPAGIDGEILVVIFDDPNQTTGNTIVLLFGAQAVAGDNFAIALAEPINLGDPNLLLDMSLGISFGYQTTSVRNQISQVDVNGTRITSSAGGQDDGAAANGGLITVGGLDDSNANPPDPNAQPTNYDYDDELYNLLPFVNDGDNTIAVFTRNPSNDDNIFFAGLYLASTTAVVGEGILLSPLNATNPVGTAHTVTAKVQNDNGDPVVGRNVDFEVVNGPHAGTTGSDVTDASGEATFTYNGINAGIDEIRASMMNSLQVMVYSNSVIKKWTTVVQYPFMTIFAVNDDVDGKLYYYSLDINSAFLNVEGVINGIQGDKDLEDLIIEPNGTMYIVNNVGTSKIYKIENGQFDQNQLTPVQAIYIGDTGLPAVPSGDSPDEVSSLMFYNGVLYALGKSTKKLYTVDMTDGTVTEVATLNVAGDFRSDGMTTHMNGTVYLLKTNTTGESEIWKFDSFPGGDISYVRQIETSGKVESLTSHPDGFLYASDFNRFFKISVTDAYIGYLADYFVDIEGMDYFLSPNLVTVTGTSLLFETIIPTSVSQDLNTVPTEYSLAQNYPNPFNPSTVINYSIPENGFVNLAVYNLLGEKVATLVNKEVAAGTYSYEFDASNLPSGIYIYQITANNYTSSQKMMLMK